MSKLKISSCDRLNPATSSPSNFTVELPQTLQGGFQLHWMYMPLLYQNVTERNNQLYFREDGVDKVATIAVGKYAGSAVLKTQVLAALNEASNGTNTYSATVNSLTNFFTFTASNTEFEFTFLAQENSCAEILGFAPTDYASTGQSLTGVRTFNLATLQTMNIDINGISSIVDTNTSVNPTLAMPIQGNLGDIQFWSPPNEHFDVSKANATRTLNIRVVDDNDELIPLEADWHMIIKKIHY